MQFALQAMRFAIAGKSVWLSTIDAFSCRRNKMKRVHLMQRRDGDWVSSGPSSIKNVDQAVVNVSQIEVPSEIKNLLV